MTNINTVTKQQSTNNLKIQYPKLLWSYILKKTVFSEKCLKKSKLVEIQDQNSDHLNLTLPKTKTI